MDIIHRVNHSMLSKGHVPKDREPGRHQDSVRGGVVFVGTEADWPIGQGLLQKK
jgi:hypothetical protein